MGLLSKQGMFTLQALPFSDALKLLSYLKDWAFILDKVCLGYVDGLICLFDTSASINDNDHLESVINVGTSIGKVGFFGEASQKLWCLTHIETLSVWDWKDARIEVNLIESAKFAKGLSNSVNGNLDDSQFSVNKCRVSSVVRKILVL
ncbi:WD repeat-containing protein GTS1 [Camellia lanceoleosa]|uniref:WD repeat-containing protein GTS1 n=1 Tax=Camellia lanceoleosa TaxID=1840588 RepID=A0ACC0HQJ3_9ERIC|nr:WD repeat-containing protein GTS1 [Camellia lanceoleosa]